MVNQIYIRTDIVNTHDKHCVYEYSVKREITLITFFKKLEAYETNKSFFLLKKTGG